MKYFPADLSRGAFNINKIYCFIRKKGKEGYAVPAEESFLEFFFSVSAVAIQTKIPNIRITKENINSFVLLMSLLK